MVIILLDLSWIDCVVVVMCVMSRFGVFDRKWLVLWCLVN